MSDLIAFVGLGFHHIVDLDAADHILFLVVLAAIYRLSDWRESLRVITAFTIGHSLTLVLAATGALRLPTPLIEFLIPVTIVVTGLENIIVRRRDPLRWHARLRPLLAGTFGLIHGAGFANYLQRLFADHITVPLLGFNIGIELGQIVVLGGCALLLTGLDRIIARAPTGIRLPAAYRLRVIGVSAAAVLVAAAMAVERRPW
ncbi:MAG: HupE/UreJ family protein [Gemmatimonadota bacterium]